MSGVTYYKLSENIYPGDTTKGCGLTGPEIDGNFHFLRGYDIKTGDLNPETGIITLNRLNGEEIKIEGLMDILSGLTSINLDGSTYDPEEGVIHLFINGDEYSGLTGFLTYKDIHTDCSLEGNGSEENPLKISEKFVNGIDEEIETAVSELSERFTTEIEEESKARNDADKALYSAITNVNESINTEVLRAKEAENALSSALTDSVSAIESAITEVNEELKSEIERAKEAESGITDSISNLEEAVTELESAVTENKEALEEAVSSLTEQISELDEKSDDIVLTKDITIDESSPLYPFLSGVWEDNVIPSGTTFTYFLEKLFSADTRMIYYIDTQLSDIDDVVENFDDLKSEATVSDIVSIKGTMGSHIIGIALPKPHNLLSVVSTQNGFTQRITDKFFVNPTRDITSDGIVYTLYYYKINVGLRASDNYAVTLS